MLHGHVTDERIGYDPALTKTNMHMSAKLLPHQLVNCHKHVSVSLSDIL